MVILEKIRAATLVETMVASVIIVIVFLIASLSLNNVFEGVVKSDDTVLQNRINEVIYFVKNEKLPIPFYEETDLWDIAIEEKERQLTATILNKKNSKEQQLIISNEAH
jgi:hypothetical protein